MEMPTSIQEFAPKTSQDPLTMGAGILGTFVIHALGAITALYFSRQPKAEFEKPERTIVMAELAKLGGGGKLPKEFMPTRDLPVPEAPKNAMADPTKPVDPTPKPTPTENNKPTNQKPSLEELLKKNASQKPSDTEGQGEGDAPPGPGQADGSENGTADKGKKGWEAEAGSYLKKYWSRSSTISDSDCASLVTGIKIKFDEALHIESCDVTKPSGDAIFDSSVCPAVGKLIDERSTFPAPPASMNLNLANKKLSISFSCASVN